MSSIEAGRHEIRQNQWPPRDRAAWDALFMEGDILEGRGPLAHWREATKRKTAQTYGFWLAFLDRTGRLDSDAAPTRRITPDAVRAYVDDVLRRCKPSTALLRVADLEHVAKAMAPAKDWQWLSTAVGRLKSRANLGELRPRADVSASQLFEWGCNRMLTVDADPSLRQRVQAVRYREGLVVALLISRPLRLRSFLGLNVTENLVEVAGEFTLALSADQMKDGKAHAFPVPQSLNAPLTRYLSHYRPILLDNEVSDALWITKDGKAFSEPGFVGQLAKLSEREFGQTLRPHAFRHIAATSVALEDPAHVGIIASILGHSTLSTSEKYYNRAQSIEAAHAYQGVINGLKKEARACASISRRKEATV